MSLSREHILKQSAALLRLGVSALDIDRTARWVDKNLPVGADPDTWIPSAASLNDDIVSEAALTDAREAWAKRAPRRFRRILDARLTDAR
jgi:hypothetical protein